MKHLHILMAGLTILIFLSQAVPIWLGKPPSARKGIKIATHVIYTLLVLSGIMTLLPVLNVLGVPHWLLGKLILLVVAISATIKALRPNTPLIQAKIGMVMALIAYMGILILAFSKPTNLF